MLLEVIWDQDKCIGLDKEFSELDHWLWLLFQRTRVQYPTPRGARNCQQLQFTMSESAFWYSLRSNTYTVHENSARNTCIIRKKIKNEMSKTALKKLILINNFCFCTLFSLQRKIRYNSYFFNNCALNT